MPDNLSPNVFVRERDISQIVPTVTSSVGGMVMYAVKGPVNVPIDLTTTADLENVFGRPNNIGYTHWFTAEAFLKASNQLRVVRVEDDTLDVSGLTVGVSADIGGNVILTETTTKKVEAFPLGYSDIKEHEAKIDYTLPEGTDPGEVDNATNNLFDTDVYHFYGVGPGSYYDDVSVAIVNSTDWNVLLDLKTELVQSFTQDEINTIAEKYYNGDAGTPATTASSGTLAIEYLSNSLIKYDVITPPAIGQTDWTIDNVALETYTNFENGPDEIDEAVLLVFNSFGDNVESYLFSHTKGKKDALGNIMFGPDMVNGKSEYIYFFIGNTESVAASVPVVSARRTYLGGASALTGETVGTGLADLTGEMQTQLIKNFSNSEEFEVDLLIDADYPDVIKRTLDDLCRNTRKDCFAILNVPLNTVLNTTNYRQIANPYTAMKNYVATTLNINSSYSSIYGNWLKVYDRFNEVERWIPASGFVAAVMARTDFSDAQWYAPAGLNRGILDNVIDIAVNPNKGQRDILYYNRINPIVKFIGEGIVIWGQKTLQSGASAFDRINVRRLFLYLEKSIRKMARYYLFELNDNFTRSRFRATVNPFLTTVQSRRGVYDFLVVCDESNNSPDEVDRGNFNAEILIKPTRVIEFIKLTFTAVATGVEFTEVVEKLA
jgi:hypothetical protein